MIMSKNKPTTILALTMVSLVAFGEPSRAQTPAPVNPAQEEIFLDVLPKVEIPDDVQPIPGAVNEEFRKCRAFWPTEYGTSQKGPEARAFRDIYGFVKVRNVIEKRDCSCIGKVAAWEDVEQIAARLRVSNNTTVLKWQQTEAVFDTSNALFPIAETMCGGQF
jgi:hypothetical protein